MKLLLLYNILFCAIICHANSGSFYSSGGQLIPKKHSTIQLKKEVLTLTRDGEFMIVNVSYEFYNPGAPLKEIVGFVTPPAAGDVGFEDQSHPQVSEFTVVFNGESLPYQINNTGKTGFSNKSYYTFEEGKKAYDFVYYFDTHFKKGINQLSHSYKFRGGSSVCTKGEFPYRLTNALDWANGSIQSFDLIVDLGPNAFGTLPSTFYENGRKVKWNAIGLAAIDTKTTLTHIVTKNMVSVKSVNGKFHFHEDNFKPDHDIMIFYLVHMNRLEGCIGSVQDKGELKFLELLLSPNKQTVSKLSYLKPEDAVEYDIKRLSNDSLTLMINFAYAYAGYMFKTEPWKTYFNQFYWYLPQQHIKGSGRVEDKELQALLNLLIKERQKRKQ